MIFYEKERAEFILKNGFSSFMSSGDLILLAKYFKSIGKNNPQTRKSLLDFCYKYNPEFNEVLSKKSIDYAMKISQNYKLRERFDVPIFQNELDIIRKLKNFKKEKILFVMLVIAKYFKLNPSIKKEKIDEKYINNFYIGYKMTEILKIAKINISKKERNNIVHELYLGGYISPTLRGSYQILFAESEGEQSILVDNLDDIVSFYPMYCSSCGKPLSVVAKRHSLCEECYAESRKTTYRESSKKYYRKNLNR